MINGLVCEVSQLRHLLNNTNIFYIFHVMCANTWTINFKCCSSFFSQAYLRLADSEQEFVCFGVVNGLVRGVPYQYQGTSWMIQTSFICPIWCVQMLWRQNFDATHVFLQPNIPPHSSFRAKFWAFWGGQRTCLWNIGTKTLPEWCERLSYLPSNVCKHLEDKRSFIIFYSQTYLHLAISEQDFERSGVVTLLLSHSKSCQKSVTSCVRIQTLHTFDRHELIKSETLTCYLTCLKPRHETSHITSKFWRHLGLLSNTALTLNFI